MNAAEIETLARRFVGAGCSVVQDFAQADVIVLNSCAVTAQAARKSRHRLRTLHRRNPEARLAVIGCWATEDLERAAALPGVAWAVPNADKDSVVARITGGYAEPAPWSPGRWGHTRAFLGVQDGCDHACTYCVTRLLRGPARSRPLDDVLAQAQAFVAQGAQEIVLTGVSLGDYGRDRGLEGGLASLVESLLQETTVPRLRLSSVEPWDVDTRLLQHWRSPRLCRQLHLPLQSGSDAVLRRMGRRITTARFAVLVAEARAIAPDIAITTDVITGFPGETEANFAESLAFVEHLAFARTHVFPYSVRAGTPAARLPDRLSMTVRRARADQMRKLASRLAQAYRERFLGAVLPVLWQRPNRAGVWRGLTDNYLAVRIETEDDLYNRIVPARLERLEGHYFWGERRKKLDVQKSQKRIP